MSGLGPWSLAWVQLAVAQWELILGAWLLTGRHRPAAWLAAFVTFSLFGLVSLRAGWVGQSSCGCFGELKADPWAVLVLDGAVVLGLLLGRPRAASVRHDLRRVAPAAAALAAGSLVLLGGLAAAGVAAFGSTAAALARLRGEDVSIAPGTIDVGRGGLSEVKSASVEVFNWTDRPIRLTGGTSDCSCVTTSDLPVTIPPHSHAPVRVMVKLPREPGEFLRRVELLTDHGEARRLPFVLSGRAGATD